MFTCSEKFKPSGVFLEILDYKKSKDVSNAALLCRGWAVYSKTISARSWPTFLSKNLLPGRLHRHSNYSAPVFITLAPCSLNLYFLWFFSFFFSPLDSVCLQKTTLTYSFFLSDRLNYSILLILCLLKLSLVLLFSSCLHLVAYFSRCPSKGPLCISCRLHKILC